MKEPAQILLVSEHLTSDRHASDDADGLQSAYHNRAVGIAQC